MTRPKRVFWLLVLGLIGLLSSATDLTSQPDCQTICQEGNARAPTYFCIAAADPHNCSYCTVTCPSGGGGGVLVQY